MQLMFFQNSNDSIRGNNLISDLCSQYTKERVEPWSRWLIAAGTYPGFYSMKRLGVFLLPQDRMLVHRGSLLRNLRSW